MLTGETNILPVLESGLEERTSIIWQLISLLRMWGLTKPTGGIM
jgi:hypothetical protein